MPIYEYECAQCGNLAEVLQKVSDPAPDVCASCGGNATLSKVVSRTSFQLKGGGWYADLYSSTPKGSGSSKESSSSKPESSSSKSDSGSATGS